MQIQMRFVGHSYKYQLESLLKMFCPTARFDYSGQASGGDACLSRIKNGRAAVWLRLGGRTARAHAAVIKDDDQPDGCAALCRLLYALLVRLTGSRPAWGMLTGVRPVKRIHRLRARGMTDGEIRQALAQRWDVSEQKARLACAVADVQQQLDIGWHPKNYSLYASIPFCPTRCRYCSFVSQTIGRQGALADEYLQRLIEELRLTAELAARQSLRLRTVYIGGGTPTALSAPQLNRLLDAVVSLFPLQQAEEFTVEAGRADTVDEQKLRVLRAHGAGRVCINPQSLNDNVLRAIGRPHTAQQVLDAFALARKAGFGCINMDFIAGLPEETPDSFAASLQTALSLRPENITVHTLSVKRSSDYYRDGVCSSGAAEMTRRAAALLTSAGYRPYYLYRQKNMLENLENVGWALPGFESPYNIAIMEENQTILACGAGSASKVVGKARIERVFDYKYPAEYCAGFQEMTRRRAELEAIVQQLTREE